MKGIFVFLLIIISTLLRAQDRMVPPTSNYASALKLAVIKFNNASTPNEYAAAFDAFEQLYKANPKDWLNPYYISLIESRKSMNEWGDRERSANESIRWIDIAKSIQVNDEIGCGESLAYTAKMAIKPYVRWLSYENKINGPLKKALIMNPLNPRIYVLQASIQKNMPSFVGGGCKSAKPLYEKATQLFLAKQNHSEEWPSWGRGSLQQIKVGCKF
jgi:hypothetical protein